MYHLGIHHYDQQEEVDHHHHHHHHLALDVDREEMEREVIHLLTKNTQMWIVGVSNYCDQSDNPVCLVLVRHYETHDKGV